MTVTAYRRTKTGVTTTVTLDLVYLVDPVHSTDYLYEKLQEVIESFNISYLISTVTHDNVNVNDSLLKLFEAKVKEKYQVMSDANQVQYFLRYNVVEGNIPCTSYIYNIAVQKGLGALRTEEKEACHAF